MEPGLWLRSMTKAWVVLCAVGLVVPRGPRRAGLALRAGPASAAGRAGARRSDQRGTTDGGPARNLSGPKEAQGRGLCTTDRVRSDAHERGAAAGPRRPRP